MKNIRRYVKPVLHAACCVMISISASAQAVREKEMPEPPPIQSFMFERMGGYLGIHDEIRVYPDGTAINEAGRKASIPPDTFSKWLRMICSVKERSAPEGSLQAYCMDCYIYQITVYKKDGTKSCFGWSSVKGDPGNSETGLAKIGYQLLSLQWK